MKYKNALIFILGALFVVWIVGCTAPDVRGQQKVVKPKFRKIASGNRANHRLKTVFTNKSSLTSPSSGNASGPVSVVNAAIPDFLSGEASVTVNPKQPTVIRLGLAQNAVSIVEFPASDGIYYIHEGNPKLASVFQSPTRETDRSITIYPGESFLASRDAASSSTTISLQMRSGLVLILELVPVADITKNAHRCVIRYNRDDVVAARKSAGLAFDLGEDIKTTPARNSKAVSKLMPGGQEISSNSEATETSDIGTIPPQSAVIDVKAGGERKAASAKKSPVPLPEREISILANKKLADCIKDPRKNLGGWSKPVAGIELAITRVTEIDSEMRLVIVAVRNGTTGNVHLLPGSPELQVQTADDKGNSLQTERIERRYVESTSLDGLVYPGATVYYALAYRAPILGTNQSIRVLVSHRDAADAPVAIPLSSIETKKE